MIKYRENQNGIFTKEEVKKAFSGAKDAGLPQLAKDLNLPKTSVQKLWFVDIHYKAPVNGVWVQPGQGE